ncbi:CatB-related O-acetyltransferase [Caenispirillum salinarum]
MPADPAMILPDPMTPYPLPGIRRVGFLKPLVDNPLIEAGEYTYYDDPEGPETFEKNVLYHFDFIGDRLVIGRFCAIAWKATFVMNGGNHRTDGISTFPFPIFGGGWSGRHDGETNFPHKGDTIIGHDVWLGHDCLVMPGVAIGHGAVIAARAVVTEDVPPYAVAAGNPARIIRRRFSDADVETLLQAAWWDWPVAKITEHLPLIVGGDVASLAAVA